MTVEHLWALPRVGSPVPDRSGELIIVPVTTYSMETNEGTTRLWAVNSGHAAPRPLTSPETSSWQPALSPDGTRLAFVRKLAREKPGGAQKGGPLHTDQPQLYLMPIGGGEPERLTDMPLGVADPLWFPDGRRIAFLAEVFLSAPTIEGTSELARSREEDPVKARVSEDRVYRYWDRWLTDGKVHHIFALDLDTGNVMDLTPGSAGWFPLMDPSDSYRIAPDGREVAFGACLSLPPHDPLLFGVFTVEVPDRIGPREAAGKLALLTSHHPADAERPVYSPDGRRIVYGIQREIDFYADRVRLVCYDRHSGEHVVLTEAWDRSAMGWSFGEDSSTVFLRAETEGCAALFSLDLESALREPDKNPPRQITSRGWFTDPRPTGGRIFSTLESLRQPPEVICCRVDGTELRRLTEFTRPVLAEVRIGAVEEITFQGAGGASVQMFVVHPPDLSIEEAPASSDSPASQSASADPPAASIASTPAPPGRRAHPLVHIIHGGPHALSGDQWHWRWNPQVFAAPGYLVALVNFQGSTGRGQEFAASILGRWGDRPYQDVMSATDALIAQGLADPRRMAVTGGSYGGYLAAWIASQTERFACIVNHAGVSDFQTEYASDVTQGRRRAMGGEPWDSIEGMDRYNPMRHARGFKSPMLVIHGERDFRVPYDQGLEIYNVYKAIGLPARLVCYPDENHWILKPRNSRHWYGEVLGWLERWLGATAHHGRESSVS